MNKSQYLKKKSMWNWYQILSWVYLRDPDIVKLLDQSNIPFLFLTNEVDIVKKKEKAEEPISGFDIELFLMNKFDCSVNQIYGSLRETKDVIYKALQDDRVTSWGRIHSQTRASGCEEIKVSHDKSEELFGEIWNGLRVCYMKGMECIAETYDVMDVTKIVLENIRFPCDKILFNWPTLSFTNFWGDCFIQFEETDNSIIGLLSAILYFVDELQPDDVNEHYTDYDKLINHPLHEALKSAVTAVRNNLMGNVKISGGEYYVEKTMFMKWAKAYGLQTAKEEKHTSNMRVRCKKWIISIINSGVPKRPKNDMFKEFNSKSNKSISGRGFIEMWKEAIVETGRDDWSKPGRVKNPNPKDGTLPDAHLDGGIAHASKE